MVRQHRWGYVDGPNAQFTVSDENTMTMTGTMCCSNYVLNKSMNETVLVKKIAYLDGGRVGSNVQMSVQITGDYQRRSVR